ncbi:MAG: hypothetical protein R3C53_08220 [Pirellulaceae bacterium]
MKALASDPAQRYESAAAFAEDIERFLDNRPVFASQPSELSILLKYAYRHRVAVGTICAIAVMLLVAVVVSTLLAIKATRAEQLAEGRSTLLAEARLRAESSLYISQMNLVQQAIRQGDLQQARGYLTRHIPEADEPDLRGFEWYYWNHHLKNYLGEVDAEQEIFSVLLAPSGKFIVCCGMGRVQFWDPQTHQLIRELHVSDEMMTGMALTRDERRLATGGKNGQVAMWDLQHNDAQVFAVEFDDPIRALALDSSGKLLFAGGVSGTVRVLDAETGTLLSEFAAHEHNVYSLDVAPDDRLLASGGGDNLAKVWQFDATGQLKLDAVQTLKEHSAAVRSVKFSPDSRLLASGSYDSRTNIWEVETGQRLHRLRGHSEEVYQAAFSPDGKTLATCSRDETIKLWDVANGFEKETLVGHRFTVYSVAYSTDGQQLVSGAFDKTLKFWDVSSAREPLVFYDHEKAIRNIAYSPDSKWLASVGDDGTIVVRTLHGKLIQQLHPARESIDSVAFLPAQDGQLTVQSRLLTGYSDGVIQVYNLPSGEPILEIEAHADRVFSIQVAPGAKQFASAGDRCVKMWDATNLQLQQQLDLSEFQSAVALALMENACGCWRKRVHW